VSDAVRLAGVAWPTTLGARDRGSSAHVGLWQARHETPEHEALVSGLGVAAALVLWDPREPAQWLGKTLSGGFAISTWRRQRGSVVGRPAAFGAARVVRGLLCVTFESVLGCCACAWAWCGCRAGPLGSLAAPVFYWSTRRNGSNWAAGGGTRVSLRAGAVPAIPRARRCASRPLAADDFRSAWSLVGTGRRSGRRWRAAGRGSEVAPALCLMLRSQLVADCSASSCAALHAIRCGDAPYCFPRSLRPSAARRGLSRASLSRFFALVREAPAALSQRPLPYPAHTPSGCCCRAPVECHREGNSFAATLPTSRLPWRGCRCR